MDVFQLMGKLVLTGKEQFEKDVNDTKKLGTELASGIGKALQTAAKVGAVAIGACATAVGAIAKASIEGFAEYEQLAGGVQKIFDEMDTTQIVADASAAYKDLGMSANEYLSVINDVGASFSATMGDQAGYEAAKKGLTAISDYASGTGKSFDTLKDKLGMITRSTSSYQSIADQFSGILPATSAGFLEQAQAAGVLSGKYKQLTDVPIEEYQKAVTDMLSLGVDALGLTGNTAAEASETISGSLAMTKSAWQNLLIGFADSSQDLGTLVDNLVEAVTAAAKNIVPKLAQIFSGISTALEQIIPVIAAELPALLEQLLPGVISGAVALVNGLIMALPSVLQILIEQLPSIITQIAEALAACFPVLLETVYGLFGQIWDYISLELLNTGTSFEDMSAKAQEVFQKLWEEIQKVWKSVGQPIWDLIQSCIDTVRNVFSEKMPEIREFVSGCFSDIQSFWENNLLPCFEAIGAFIEGVLAPVFDAVFTVTIGGIVDTVFNTIKDLWENTLKPVFTGITDFLTGVFTGDWDQALNGILEIATGIWNGIQTAIETPMEAAKNLVNEAIDFIKEKFDFDWELPKIKLPHFTITGSFSLNPPSIPHFSVSWYKKAYDEAMVLKDPTIFGYSAASNKLLGGGEGNGNEVVAGEAHLMNMIQKAMAEQNEALAYYLQQLTEMVADYFPQVIEAAGHDIVTNDGAIIARYTPMFNTALGKISRGKDRGR